MYLDLETYLRPETVADCLAALTAPHTAVIAGGTSLNIQGHERIKRLVDLQSLPLRGIEADEDALRIGALTPLSELAGTLEPDLAAVGQAAAAERNLAIRNRSTVGGRISRDRSDGRLATALLAVNAQIELLSPGVEGDEIHERLIPLEAYLTEVATDTKAGIVASVVLESSPAFSGYLSSELTAVDAPTADVAIAVCLDGKTRVTSGGHAEGAEGVVYLRDTSEVVEAIGHAGFAEGWEAKVRGAALGELPSYDDARASGDYRRDLAATLIVRLVDLWRQGRES